MVYLGFQIIWWHREKPTVDISVLHQLAFSQPKPRQNLFWNPEKLLFVNTTFGWLQATFLHFPLWGFNISQITSSLCRPSKVKTQMIEPVSISPNTNNSSFLWHIADSHASCILNMLNTICAHQTKSLGHFFSVPCSWGNSAFPQVRASPGWKQHLCHPLHLQDKRQMEKMIFARWEEGLLEVASFFFRSPKILSGPWDHCQPAHRPLYASL